MKQKDPNFIPQIEIQQVYALNQSLSLIEI